MTDFIETATDFIKTANITTLYGALEIALTEANKNNISEERTELLNLATKINAEISFRNHN